MKKCSHCRKEVEKLWPSSCLKEERRLYGRPLEYFKRFPDLCRERNIQPEHWEWEVTCAVTWALCDDCINKRYVLRHTKAEFIPFPYSPDWKETKDSSNFEKVYL